MALIGTDKGSGARNTGGETTYAINPASIITAGSMAVLSLACDNAAAGGGNPYSTVTDSVGNVWTNRVIQTKTAGVANDGVSVGIYDSLLTASINTTDTITVTFSTTTVARAYTLTQVSSNSAVVKLVYADNAGANSASTTPSTTTHALVRNGHLILGVIGAEMGDGTITADSDTTNGSWSTAQTANVGVTTAGMEICSQYKVVNANGAQTYNATITSANWSTGVMHYTDVVSGIIPIGYAAADGATITIPVGHQRGDLIVIFSFRTATTAPSLPAGWTNLTSNSSGASSMHAGYKLAISSSDTSGTWTNATGLICHVYRGTATNKTPVVIGAQNTGTGTSITYGARNPMTGYGSSWIVGFAATKTLDSALETAPTNLTNVVNTVGAAVEYAGHDSNGIYAASAGSEGKWPATVVSVAGTSAEWRALSCEIFAEQGLNNNFQFVKAGDGMSVSEKIR